ncbi:hypothetical protein V6N13_148638 [Hibiscus sabdariffa]
MSESRFAQISNFRGSSSKGDSVGMEGNFPRQNESQFPIQPPEPVRTLQNPPNVQTIQRECFLSMKEMFDQFVMNLKQEQSVAQVVVNPRRAPIEKLLQNRAYPFAGTIKVKPEEAEYWLERINPIVTEQLSCSDEHKLECAIAFLIDEALSWWETKTLTVPAEKITWEFFMVEFKKKYISEQHFEERRKKFLYPNQGRKPISQYASKFRNYSGYDLETRGECSRQKAKRSGSNHIPRLQSVIRTQVPIDNDRTQWQSKKAKYHHENPITYTPVSRSNFTPRPPNDIKLTIPTDSVRMITSSEIVLEIFRKSQLNVLQNQASLRLFGIKALNKFNLEIREEVKEIIRRLLLIRNPESQFEFIMLRREMMRNLSRLLQKNKCKFWIEKSRDLETRVYPLLRSSGKIME